MLDNGILETTRDVIVQIPAEVISGSRHGPIAFHWDDEPAPTDASAQHRLQLSLAGLRSGASDVVIETDHPKQTTVTIKAIILTEVPG